MKVSFFTSTRRDCGIADYSRFLLDHLRKRVEVEVFPSENLRSVEDHHTLGRRMATADLAHIQYEHGLFLAKDLPAENFNALMSALRIPTLLTLHCPPLDHPLWQHHLEDPGLSFLVHSREHAQLLQRRGARGPVDVMAHPATPRQATSVSSAAYRRTHGLEREIVLAIFGFTKPHKGYALALEALSRLPEDTVLMIAGGPQDEADACYLSELLHRAEVLRLERRVHVTGYIPTADVGAALQAIDVVLAPFTTMTASGSVATALAWGRPVVASDLPPNVELHGDFRCLALFQNGSVEALAATIQSVLEKPGMRRSLVAGARLFRRKCSYRELAARSVVMYEREVDRSCRSSREC